MGNLNVNDLYEIGNNSRMYQGGNHLEVIKNLIVPAQDIPNRLLCWCYRNPCTVHDKLVHGVNRLHQPFILPGNLGRQ